ncbi:MAG TPA: immunoglobulin domain-containing protein [Clostridia bacterium]|nr:immunoglobulin domain-containing protein [Clostridia bacterium]
MGNTPNVKVYIDGMGVLLPGGPDGFTTAAVGGSNPYWYVAFEFVSSAASQTFSIVNDATGDQTLLVDDFQIALSTGKWEVASWMGDADSGIDASYFYTHAYNFGNSASVVINDVTFTGIAGAAPAAPGRFSTTYLGQNPVHDDLVFVFDNSMVLASDFVYGGNVPAGLFQSIALEGLTPGTEYVLTVYSVGWENPNEGNRWATFSMGSDYRTINQDQFFQDGGIRVSYRYTADATGKATLKFSPFNPVNVSFHVYGFSNREAESRFVAPLITTQPKSRVLSPDLAVDFSVSASGVPSPGYQWRFNGAPIADATSSVYSIPTISAANAGAYDVVVTNVAGMVTSVVARLTVGMPLANPSFEADLFGSWPGYVAGNPGAGDNGPITGWTSLNNHGLNPVSDNRSPFADNGAIPHGGHVAFLQGDGTFSQLVSGFTVGGQYYLHYFENARGEVTLPGISVSLGGKIIVPAHTLTVAGGGNNYREISSEVFTATAADMDLVFTKSSPVGGDCTALIDNVAIVSVPPGTPPSVSSHPVPATVYLGQAASFSALAQGSLPLSYQWQLDGSPILGATSNRLDFTSVQLANEGNYSVVVTNSFGAVTSAVARLSLLEHITTLHNTGVDGSGTPLPPAAADPFWKLTINPDGQPGDAIVGDSVPGVWMGNNTASKWIGPRAELGNAGIAAGSYLYRTTFDLSGRDTNTVIISGRWSADDGGTAVYINGATVSVPLAAGFGGWTGFTLTTNTTSFLPGTNILEFAVNNGSAGPTAVRVEFTQTSARTLPGVPAGVGVQPKGARLAEGDNYQLAVTATGTLPISYQWRKDGIDLTGKTDSTLTLTAVTSADSGTYSVVVSNMWGLKESSNAIVLVAYRPLPGFFGTGLNANHQMLTAGEADQHYILAASSDPAYPGPDAVVLNDAWPIAPAGPWIANGPSSKWIGPRQDQNQAGNAAEVIALGEYTYQTTLDLTGQAVNKVSVAGELAADDGVVDILINGVSTGINLAGFDTIKSFSITNGFVAGVNTLDFKVSNGGVNPSPSGLRVNLRGYLSILAETQTQMHIQLNGANVSISWAPAESGQKLEWAPTCAGPWEQVVGAANPYVTSASGTPKFYRIVQ